MPAHPAHDRLAKVHLVALLLFLVLAIDVVQGGPVSATDDDVSAWVDGRTSPRVEWSGREVLAAPGHTEVAILLLALGTGLAFWMGVSRNGWFMFLPGVVGLLLIPALKGSFDRTRPSEIIGTGAFPSGHALKAVFIVGLVFALTWDAFLRRRRGFAGVRAMPGLPRLLAVVWAVGIVSTMAGRVVGNVHWWTDTVGGALLGLLLLSGTLFLHATLPATAREKAADELLARR